MELVFAHFYFIFFINWAKHNFWMKLLSHVMKRNRAFKWPSNGTTLYRPYRWVLKQQKGWRTGSCFFTFSLNAGRIPSEPEEKFKIHVWTWSKPSVSVGHTDYVLPLRFSSVLDAAGSLPSPFWLPPVGLSLSFASIPCFWLWFSYVITVIGLFKEAWDTYLIWHVRHQMARPLQYNVMTESLQNFPSLLMKKTTIKNKIVSDGNYSVQATSGCSLGYTLKDL